MRCIAADIAALLLLAQGAAALAAFRGEERSHRSFTYNSEYFFQSKSFSIPPWWEAEWRGGDTGYRMALGSIKTDEFYLFQEGKIGRRLADAIDVAYRFLNEEDYDSRHWRHNVSLAARISRNLSLKAFTELSAEKEWIDLGAEAKLLAPGVGEARVSLNLVDMTYNLKSGGAGKYLRQPYGIEAGAAAIPARGVEVSLFLDLDLPLRLDDRVSGFEFAFYRYRAGVRAKWEPDPYWEVQFEASGEICGKRWEFEPYTSPADPPNPGEEAMSREAMKAGVDVLRRLALDGEDSVSAGLWWIQLRETSVFPNNHVSDNRLKKRDFIAYLKACVDLGGGFFLSPAVYAGPVMHVEHYVNDPSRCSVRRVPLNSKLTIALGVRFSKSAILLGGASFALDRFEFDGGQAAFVVAF